MLLLLEKLLAWIGGLALVVLALFGYRKRQLSTDDASIVAKQAGAEAVLAEKVKTDETNSNASESDYHALRDEYLSGSEADVPGSNSGGGSGTSH